MDYFQKYLKYKNKYHNLLNKKGGALVFNEFGNGTTSLLKTKTQGDSIKFDKPTGQSNNFTEQQKKDIQIMTNFILPFVSYKGKKLGYDFIKEVQTFGAGTFGTTIAYDNLLIKIMTKNPKSNAEIDEINILENLFNTPSQVPPDTMSKYLGFISGKDLVQLKKFDTYQNGEINLFSNLFNKPEFKILDNSEIHKRVLNLYEHDKVEEYIEYKKYLQDRLFSGMMLTFFEKEDGDMDKFIAEICPKISIEQKVLSTKDFFLDMYSALNFLHITKNKFHSDVKSPNAVYKVQKDGTIKFKLIDFGTVSSLDPKSGRALEVKGGSSFYFIGTNYFKNEKLNLSYMYDYFCVICIILEIWGINLDRGVKVVADLMDSLYKIYIQSKFDLNICIDHLIKYCASNFKIILPDPSTNPEIKDTYKILIPYLINGNIPTGSPPALS
jgi:hypothetical protein